jgi:SAM-dependent methyltransferase
MAHLLRSLLEQAHEAVALALRDGDLAIDATVGNGHDTIHLANCVGASGHVIGCDVQPIAIELARQRLASHGLDDRVTLFESNHDQMNKKWLEKLTPRPLRVVMFNLGYLPGGDHAIRTTKRTTVDALEASYALLDPPGLISVVTYVGHRGAEAERLAVLEWGKALERQWPGVRADRPRILESRFHHADHETGSLILIERPAASVSP